LPLLPEIVEGQFSILSAQMNAGDCLVFHARLVHGAPGNRSAMPHRALSMRWVGEGARFRATHGEEVIPGQRDTIQIGAYPDDWVWAEDDSKQPMLDCAFESPTMVEALPKRSAK
jgi:hypothetical protein